MDFTIVQSCFDQGLSGQINFPDSVAKMRAAGVERYIVDLVAMFDIVYGVDNTTQSIPLKLANLHPVPDTFDEIAVRQAIMDVQLGKTSYREFLHAIMNAGCALYHVYLNGEKVIYMGRDGGMHVENFPGAVEPINKKDV